jgi:hypothetical protein
MLKKYNLSSNIGLIFIVVLVMTGLFGLTTVFAASGTGLLNRRINVESTAQAIRFENRRVLLQATADHRLAELETEVEQARQSLETMRQTVQAQRAAQTKQLTAIRQEVQRKQAAVKELESKLIQVQLGLKADEESFNANPLLPQAEQEQEKAGLLRQISAVETQMATAQAQLAARLTPLPPAPTATSTPIINNPDPNDSGSKDHPDSSTDDDDDDDDDDKSEDNHSHDDKPDDPNED